MSHIVNNKDDLMLVNDIFQLLRKENISTGLLEEILKNLMPKDSNGNLFSDYLIYDRNGGVANFNLNANILNLSIKEMYKVVSEYCKKISNYFEIKDISLFKDYLFLWIVCHEIEHNYQYLMAYGLIESPCELVGNGYKLIIDVLRNKNLGTKKIRNSISYYLYMMNSGMYVIERNANVESMDLMEKLSIRNGHYYLAYVFNKIRESQLVFGYITGNKGCFETTCNAILLGHEYRKLNHDFDLTDKDRLRYGLPISKETRKEMHLVKMKKI